MGPLIVADIILLVFCIYVGVFIKYFHTSYPDMDLGFHVWEVCFSQKTWAYGNKFAGNLSIILGIILFGLVYPGLIYLKVKRSYLTILIVLFVIIYLLALLAIVKIRMRKKFNLKDK